MAGAGRTPAAGGLGRDGLTDEQIAHNMGITAKTLYVWKSAYGEICEALKKGKEIVDIQVENALLKRALGYEYMEERVEISEKDGRKVIQTTKTVPPDTTAQISGSKTAGRINGVISLWRGRLRSTRLRTML